MAEPRKITIKLRPVGAKPAGAPTPPAPPAAPAAAPAAPAAEVGTEAAQQAKRQTSRIELPPELIQQPMNAASATPAPPAEPPADAGKEAAVTLKPISSDAAPAKEETQAAKSKTARIALDSVLGGIQANAPLANTTQKTIKLKRATPTPSLKPKASAPMAPVGAKPADEEKTIKLKRPATLSLKRDAAPAPAAEPELEPLENLDDVPLAPLDGTPAAPVQESTGAKVFTIISVVAACASIIVTLILCIILQKQAASPDGSPATGNTLHSLPFKSF